MMLNGYQKRQIDDFTAIVKDNKIFNLTYNYRDLFLQTVKKDAKILDVGCADSSFLEFLKQNGYKYLAGLDIAPNAVLIGAARGFWIECDDIHATRYNNESFDVISLSHILEHSWNPKVVIRECYRLLKSNGLLFVEIPIERFTANSISSAHYTFFENKHDCFKYISPYFEILKHGEGDNGHIAYLIIMAKKTAKINEKLIQIVDIEHTEKDLEQFANSLKEKVHELIGGV